ncbi:hypothetical protein R6G99_09885, partial [Actinotignum timonense]|nr:hypothetical protein [Actinotignum timonense]
MHTLVKSPALRARAAPRERGNILILGLGTWALSAVLCLGFVYLATVLTARHTLQGQADSAALAISQEITRECYFSSATLSDCHPSPEERNTSMRISVSGISIWSVCSISG